MRQARFVREGIFGADIESPADEILIDAWDATTPAQRVKLARKALSVDLDAIDAYNILGIHAASAPEAIALFREAAAIGERLFAPAFGDEDMVWWSYMGTRPWMRAQHNLGLALVSAGDRDGAVAVFKRLLALNPNDNQGIRTLLLQLAAETGDYGSCRILLADYPEDVSIEFVATALLLDLAGKRKIDFKKHFEAIAESNVHLLPLLATAAKSNRWPRASDSDYVTWGGKDAAAVYLHHFKAAWQRNPKFLAGFLEAYRADTSKDPK